eukprot:364740-Chlamydomonas_euryale.AAC.3
MRNAIASGPSCMSTDSESSRLITSATLLVWLRASWLEALPATMPAAAAVRMRVCVMIASGKGASPRAA